MYSINQICFYAHTRNSNVKKKPAGNTILLEIPN